MTDETQSTDTGENVVNETLDDVIAAYNVQAPVAQESSQQTQTYSAPQQPPKLDPLDDSSVNEFANYVSQNTSALDSQIREMRDKLTRFEQKEAELRIEADINKAVESINEGIGLNPRLVRVHLELAAQEKPAFKKVWENRHNDPKTYTRAIKAIQKEIADTYSVRQDPELTETQAAIQQSQKSMASQSGKPSTNSVEERLAKASGNDFEREWQRLLGHG